MSIVYDGSHSITFIKTGSNNAVTTKKTWVDWHLVPASRPIVNPPQPSLSMLSIPGSSKILDMTEVLGSVSFSTRTGEWEFLVDNDYWDDWVDAYNTIMTWINGSKLQCVLDDDPTTIYTGRFVFGAWKTGASYSSCTIQYTLEYYAEEATLRSISATFNQNGRVLSPTLPEEAFREGLTVTANYSSGVSYVVKDYTITGVSPGDIVVSYGGDATVVSYSYTQDIIIGLEAVYRQPIEDIYPSASPNSLKEDLAVFKVYNTGKKEAISSSDYVLSGTLSVGKSTVTVSFGGETTTFDVWVSQSKLTSISATFNQGNNVIYTSDSLDSLRQYLTVVAERNDGSTFTVSNYTLSGTLTSGTSTISVSYEGKTASFNVSVTAVADTSISATFNQGNNVIYTSDSLDSLRQYLTVVVERNDGSTFTVSNYTLRGTLTSGTTIILVSYEGKTASFNVSVTAVTVTSISATFNQGNSVIYTTDSLDSLRQYLTVVAERNDGPTFTVSNYTLSGTLTSGTSTISVSYEGKTASFNVTVTEAQYYFYFVADRTRTVEPNESGISTSVGVSDSQPELFSKLEAGLKPTMCFVLYDDSDFIFDVDGYDENGKWISHARRINSLGRHILSGVYYAVSYSSNLRMWSLRYGFDYISDHQPSYLHYAVYAAFPKDGDS